MNRALSASVEALRIKTENEDKIKVSGLATSHQSIASSYSQLDGGQHGEVEEEPKQGFRKYITLKLYVGILVILGFLVTTDVTIRFSLLTTLQRRFGFQTVMNGVIAASADVGHLILLAFFSVFGHRVHKPRSLFVGALLTVTASLLWALPHFIFGPGPKPEATVVEAGNLSEIIPPLSELGVCLSNSSLGASTCELIANKSAANGVDTSSNESTTALVLFILSQCFIGAGLAPYVTVSFTYIDDNTDPQTSSLYVAIVMSVAMLGAIAGFLLGATFTSLYVDLGPTNLKPSDPEWIGAYWLGSLVLQSFMLLAALPLLLFPRHLRKPVTVTESHIDSEKTTAEKMRQALQRRVSEISDVKDLQEKVPSLFKNVVYLSATMVMICMSYLAGGVMTFLPKYIEDQFALGANMANIITSIAMAGSIAAGTFVGGWIVSARGLDISGSAKLIVFGCFTGVVCFVISMFLGCEPSELATPPQANLQIPPYDTCQSSCNCTDIFTPVCSEDNKQLFYSPCHAGCSDIVSYSKGEKGPEIIYTNCTCVEGPNKNLKSGFCKRSCPLLIPYTIVIFISTFSICLGQSPIISMVIRSVMQKQKSLALGLNNIATSLFATMIAPILYGRAIDTTCILLAPDCGDGKNVCLKYNAPYFRYYLHGITITFMFLALVFLVVIYLKTRNKPDPNGPPSNKEDGGEEMKELNGNGDNNHTKA
ncbi:DgyrCDS4888 [Dimorphilus gyrociliatus]|uniref:Solute carrier organic anion transporter family member n=1 Tax=Dimorphilus gyrociliatus TaxID=2664684 RepID=A0A7I8VJS8_9ANNE|nr:DgyrCDS4888 [Dimorphilus gyrociliatus]